jgi:D-alanyl-D-alanine carboxypeptidase
MCKRKNECAMSLGLFLTLVTNGSAAQAKLQPDPAMQTRVDEVIQRCLREDRTPSASVAIVENGRLFYAVAFGDAVMQPKKPALETTRYQLASISKTFTAQAVLLLEADGKLSLDDKVSHWYPTLTNAANVSLRELLNHTSGYPDHYQEGYPAGAKGKAVNPDQIIEEWGHHPLLFPSGTQFHYSNLEYEILGRIVEKESGRPLFAFMQERIFRPLSMNATIDLDSIPDASPILATGYTQTALSELEPAPYEGSGWSFGAGQVVTTAKDVALWDIAFLQRHVLPPKQAEEEVTIAHLTNGATYPAALGLFVSHAQGLTRYYHSGEGLGFEAVNMIFPDRSLALVILTNTNAAPTYLKIADELTYLLLPPSADDAFARSLFAGLQTGKLDLTNLSEDLKHYLTPKRLGEYNSSLMPLGPLQALSLLRATLTDGFTTKDYDVIVGGQRLRMHLLLLPDKKVEDVSISRQ